MLLSFIKVHVCLYEKLQFHGVACYVFATLKKSEIVYDTQIYQNVAQNRSKPSTAKLVPPHPLLP